MNRLQRFITVAALIGGAFLLHTYFCEWHRWKDDYGYEIRKPDEWAGRRVTEIGSWRLYLTEPDYTIGFAGFGVGILLPLALLTIAGVTLAGGRRTGGSTAAGQERPGAAPPKPG